MDSLVSSVSRGTRSPSCSLTLSLSHLLTHTRQVREVFSILSRHHSLTSQLFHYYASLDRGVGGSSDISIVEWTALANECKLVDPKSTTCRRVDMERIFIQVATRNSPSLQQEDS